MLTHEEQERLQQLEIKPFGSLTPSENAELAYLRHKKDGDRAGFIGRDENMPEDPDRSPSGDSDMIGRDPDVP
jgi:hypothetical protein